MHLQVKAFTASDQVQHQDVRASQAQTPHAFAHMLPGPHPIDSISRTKTPTQIMV